MKAKEKLGDSNADIIADLLHIEEYDPINKKGLCPWHNEDTPSFIYNPKIYSFHCFGCSRNTDIIDAYMHSGQTYLEALQSLFKQASIPYAFGEKGVKTRHQYKYPRAVPLNDKKRVYEYMQKRGISKETVDKADVREDERGNVVFNYYDANDVLCLVKYRPSHPIDKSKGEIKCWCQKDSDTTPLLFNMNRVNVNSPLLVTEGECFPGDAEVLTPQGWVQLRDYREQEVLQVDDKLNCSFVLPKAYINKKYNGNMIECRRGGNYSSITTSGHNIVFFDYMGRLTKRPACDMPKSIGGKGYIPTTAHLNGCGIPLTDDQIALYLAVSADCTIDKRKTPDNRYCRFSVKKTRKYQRMKVLLDSLNISYFVNTDLRDGYKYLGFKTPNWIESKILPWEWITLATERQRKFILEEMVEWDGNRVKDRTQTEYTSKIYENVLFIQTMAHTCGMMSTIQKRKNQYGAWYKCSVLNKRGVSIQGGFGTKKDYNGEVYCVSVDTGMILVRQEGHITVSGNCDALAAIEAGYSNVVSVPLGANNYGWIEENFDWLEQFDDIIVCSDNDEPGLKMQKECVFRLGSWRTKFIEIPHIIRDEKSGRDIVTKDLNEVLYYGGKNAVLKLIHDAKDPGVPSVVDLSDITDIDLDEIDGITTGISSVDSELMKIFYGTLTIISGQPGAGKTSFLDQLVCSSMDAEKNVWIFSREMPSWMTKSWMNYILAGKQNIKEYHDANDSPYYKVSPDIKTKINNHYRERCFIYKDDESNKLDDLIVSMTDSVRKYGTKLLILDNLMTINLNSNENDELLKQTEAINKLIGFAMKYSVAVVLVAHPRKMPRDVDVGIYDISGTANISNLAHRTIGLKRVDHNNPKNKTNYDVEVTIIKDRMRGRMNKCIGLYYDIPSRRFYTNEKEYNHQYKWDTSSFKPLPFPHPDESEVYGKLEGKLI